MSDETLPTPDGLVATLADSGVLSVQFDRPHTLNSLSRSVAIGLLDVLDVAANRARAVILTGGDRAFCSGADLSADREDGDDAAKGVGLDIINEFIRRIAALHVPTIAAVAGPAAGVGCSLALVCDYVVMSRDSYLMLAFTKIGLMPDGGATALVAASAGRHRALRMALSAEKVYAEQALEWGLASEVTEPGQHLLRAGELACAFAAGPAQSLGSTIQAINAVTLSQLDEALEREFDGQKELLASADFAEGAAAFRAKRPAKFAR